jgi:hypothetical protein
MWLGQYGRMASSVWARGLTGVDMWLNCKHGSKGTRRSGSRGHCRTNARAGRGLCRTDIRAAFVGIRRAHLIIR